MAPFVVRNVLVHSNRACWGGGISNWQSNALIFEDVEIYNNKASCTMVDQKLIGGGIYNQVNMLHGLDAATLNKPQPTP